MPTSRPNYDLLAIDLDGTLYDSKGLVSESNRRAVQAARDAGLRVVICTGRGLAECADGLQSIDQTEPVVVAGGAIIACPVTKRTLHRFAISRAMVERTVELVLRHNHPALVLKDPSDSAYDYLVVRGPGKLELDPVTTWWFEKMDVRVRTVDSLAEDDHPEHTVRVGACGLSGKMAVVESDLAGDHADDVYVHHFPAVVAPHHAKTMPDGQVLHVLEVFDKNANKWSAVSQLTETLGIDARRVAAIGDQINDLAMIENAGLGIAMGNAIPLLKHAAKRQTKGNDADGVAHAISQILSGSW